MEDNSTQGPASPTNQGPRGNEQLQIGHVPGAEGRGHAICDAQEASEEHPRSEGPEQNGHSTCGGTRRLELDHAVRADRDAARAMG